MRHFTFFPGLRCCKFCASYRLEVHLSVDKPFSTCWTAIPVYQFRIGQSRSRRESAGIQTRRPKDEWWCCHWWSFWPWTVHLSSLWASISSLIWERSGVSLNWEFSNFVTKSPKILWAILKEKGGKQAAFGSFSLWVYLSFQMSFNLREKNIIWKQNKDLKKITQLNVLWSCVILSCQHVWQTAFLGRGQAAAFLLFLSVKASPLTMALEYFLSNSRNPFSSG